jgi:hypothetical protein
VDALVRSLRPGQCEPVLLAEARTRASMKGGPATGQPVSRAGSGTVSVSRTGSGLPPMHDPEDSDDSVDGGGWGSPSSTHGGGGGGGGGGGSGGSGAWHANDRQGTGAPARITVPRGAAKFFFGRPPSGAGPGAGVDLEVDWMPEAGVGSAGASPTRSPHDTPQENPWLVGARTEGQGAGPGPGSRQSPLEPRSSPLRAVPLPGARVLSGCGRTASEGALMGSGLKAASEPLLTDSDSGVSASDASSSAQESEGSDSETEGGACCRCAVS